MRIDENPPIWVLHSQTITDHKKLFFLSFKDMKLMFYAIYNSGNNPTLLHQANDDTKKVY